MRELPTGTVTFLFTDIEGSTRLLQELGAGYRAVQEQHTEIVRLAIAEAGGTEIRTEGDSFFAVFPKSGDAVLASVIAQQRLASNAWPHGRPLRVRMGLHTGEGVLGGDDYLGIDVNRAARIAAAASGGQVLLSGSTAILAEHTLAEGIAIRSLGHHRLKDLGRPEHLHDLVVRGLQSQFPPPRSMEVPSNLPPELTSFVGREREIDQGRALLARTRQLTVTGPGGTGKTRLALRIAAGIASDFPDGTFFVDLVPVSDPALVMPTIASTLGVREEGWERPIAESLEDHLRDRRLLLVLDNFEQVLGAAPLVTRLLSVAPSVKIVVTSRAPLRLQVEQELPLSSLTLPHEGARMGSLSQNEAVTLFVQRASAVDPNFTLTDENAAQVGEIVARLDGLPLAIELAAMRIGVLTPATMMQRMDRLLPLLGRGARDLPARQMTLRAAVRWSYDLLAHHEQVFFRRLSVMNGGATLEAAAGVCDPSGEIGVDVLDVLSSLADSSLVQTSTTPLGGIRFGMLQTVREFALGQLDDEGELWETRRRHAGWFLDLAEEAEPNLRGPEILQRMMSVQLEHDNLRAALGWAIEDDAAELGLRMASALWRFWHLGGHLTEGRRWAAAVLSLPSAAEPTVERSKALAALGGLAYWQTDLPATRQAYEEALAISRRLGNSSVVAEGTYNLAFAYGLVPTRAGSRELFLASRAMFDQLDNRRGVADSLWGLALLARLGGDYAAARAQAEASVLLHQENGDAVGLVDALGELGRAAFGLGDLDVARSSFLQTLEIIGQVRYRTAIAIAFDNLAAFENSAGETERGLRLAGASEALKESAGGQVPPEFVDLPDIREAARAILSPERITSVWEEGRSMTLQEALTYARSERGR